MRVPQLSTPQRLRAFYGFPHFVLSASVPSLLFDSSRVLVIQAFPSAFPASESLASFSNRKWSPVHCRRKTRERTEDASRWKGTGRARKEEGRDECERTRQAQRGGQGVDDHASGVESLSTMGRERATLSMVPKRGGMVSGRKGGKVGEERRRKGRR